MNEKKLDKISINWLSMIYITPLINLYKIRENLKLDLTSFI